MHTLGCKILLIQEIMSDAVEFSSLQIAEEMSVEFWAKNTFCLSDHAVSLCLPSSTGHILDSCQRGYAYL